MSAKSDLESDILQAYNTAKEESSSEDADADAITEQLAQDMADAIDKFVKALVEDHTDDENH